MRNAFFLITLFSLFCCNNTRNEKENSQGPIPNSSSERAVVEDQSSNKKRVVYVTAASGLSYRAQPNLTAKKLGSFDLGTRLNVLEETGIQLEVVDNGKSISGQWIQVVLNDHDWKNKDRYQTGYVFDGFTVDSLDADFSKLPQYFNYSEFKQPDIKFEALQLKLTKIAPSEFESYAALRTRENKGSKKVVPWKSVGNPEKGGYFTLDVKDRLLKFPCGENYFRPCYTYGGFFKEMNAYSIGRFGESIYESFFLDKDNGSIFFPSCGYDHGAYGLIVSPSNEKILVSSSIDYDTFKEFYDARSTIVIYDIKNCKHLDDIKTAYSYASKDWEIYRVYWIDDQSFVMEVFDKTKLDEDGQQVPVDLRYLKAEIE